MKSTGCHDTASWQFSMRAMFVLTGGIAVLVALITNCRVVYGIGGFEFWVALLMPVWIPLLFFPERTTRERLRPLLALIPIGWYLVLMLAYQEKGALRTSPTPLAIGTLVALLTLAVSAKGWRLLVNVPLAFAVLSATIWLIVM